MYIFSTCMWFSPARSTAISLTPTKSICHEINSHEMNFSLSQLGAMSFAIFILSFIKYIVGTALIAQRTALQQYNFNYTKSQHHYVEQSQKNKRYI